MDGQPKNCFATSKIKIAEAAANPTAQQQQQKLKDCNEKWKEERANTGAKAARPTENSSAPVSRRHRLELRSSDRPDLNDLAQLVGLVT